MLAVISAAQGQLLALYHGRPQPWWPALGYAAAIFSVWALLTPALLRGADLLTGLSDPRLRVAAHVAGLPIAVAVHVLVFVQLFWPVYGSGTAAPLDMARPVLLSNLDTASVAYAAVIVAAYLRRRGAATAVSKRAGITAPAPGPTGIWVNSTRAARFIRFDEIDWIGAAGDYSEVHVGKQAILADKSLAALVDELPPAEFARIHRGAIVRLDRVQQMRGIGRGDAELQLRGGEALRLSRRFRSNLAPHLVR